MFIGRSHGQFSFHWKQHLLCSVSSSYHVTSCFSKLLPQNCCCVITPMIVMAERRSRYGSGKLLIAVLAFCLYPIIYHKNEVRANFQVIGLFSTFYSKHFCSLGNSYLKSRVLHMVNGTSSFQLDWIALSGDVYPQPGPAVNVKYPCKECQRNVRLNQNAILCANCKTWSHGKCLRLVRLWPKGKHRFPVVHRS